MKLVNTHILILFFLNSFSGFSQQDIWSLDRCLDSARVNNLKLRIAENQQTIISEKHDEAVSGLYPKIAIAGDYRYYTNLPYQLLPLSVFGGPDGVYKETQFGVPHVINANVQFNMNLYNPQTYGAIDVTNTMEEIAAVQYQRTEEQLFFEISNLFYNAVIIQYQIRFIDSNLVNAGQLLNIVTLLHEQKMVKTTDADKIKLQVAQLELNKQNAASKQTQIHNQLKFMMGISDQIQLVADTTLNLFQPEPIVLNETNDLKLNRLSGEVLQTELQTIRRTRIPMVSLYGVYGTTGYGYTGDPQSFLDFYPVGYAGVQLVYPLFNGFAINQKIDQKELEIQNNQYQQELIYKQTSMQVDNAILQRSIAYNMVQSAQTQIQLGEEIYKQIKLQFEQETASLTEVLLADLAVRESQQIWINAIVDYFKADLELKKVSGNFNIKE
ncbi:MAG: TolC family protein [Crocinitomicaceae bacterium]|nr:TolC family protein [Crocinitomicaceae bacterium]MBK8927081.1 TolC family protein [Crocinitomicaceae bacterium]